ncbi:MAG: hypothetical protein U0263_14335 [Polyangiaceae bacterium]
MAALEPLRALFDVVVDGVNVTARVGEAHALHVLAELAHAVANLRSGRRRRATVQLYAEQEVWELGIESDGDDALLSVFRSGPLPEVAVHERRVSLAELGRAVRSALAEAPLAGAARGAEAAIAAALRALDAGPKLELPRLERQRVELQPRPTRGIAVWAKGELGHGGAPVEALSERKLERADLHALLVAGEAGFTIRGKSASLGTVHLFLLAERLLALSDDALEAWQQGRALFRRVELGPARISVQRGVGDLPLSLSVQSPASGPERLTFPELDPAALVQACVRFAKSLTDALIAADPSQARNLRLGALSSQCRALADRVEDALADDSLTNSAPESYRSFSVPPRRSESKGRWEHGGKMRFVPRWVAAVPNIDLRGTFLCGDRLIVGSERETACIHRSHGTLLWRVPSLRAASVATPVGIARLSPDGRLAAGSRRRSDALHAEPQATRRRRAAGRRGAHAGPTEAPGRRRGRTYGHRSGPRERRGALATHAAAAGHLPRAARRQAPARGRRFRAGRARRRERRGRVALARTPALHRGRRGGSRFRVRDLGQRQRGSSLDARSVERRSGLERRDRRAPAAGQPPLLTPSRVVVAVRDRRGAGLVAFERTSGTPAFSKEPGLSAPTTAWLSVDRDLVGNGASGTLLCIDGESGEVRYSHVFPRHVDADQPRRLEPVLRSGALFVPQHQVHVVRPRDGEILGTVPTDLIPDLLRVDERCDVYVAEESGHIAGFGVAAKLTLVR